MFKDDVDFRQRVAELLNNVAIYDAEMCTKKSAHRKTSNGNEMSDDDSEGEEGQDNSSFCLAANSHILEILRLLLSSPSPSSPSFDLQPSQAMTVDTLRHLINHPDTRNKKALADHEDILTALVNLCLTITKGSTKDEAKRIILALVPEL
mmetsp:Transcript_17853/g.48557  ORF Transcript_17853/g.48557 Transcript_17853/m.48557 type:complete len:150 (+) Transcript_17853:3-452(+)